MTDEEKVGAEVRELRGSLNQLLIELPSNVEIRKSVDEKKYLEIEKFSKKHSNNPITYNSLFE